MVDPFDTVAAFAARNGLIFQDWSLLRVALTHRSYLNEHPDLEIGRASCRERV